MSSKLQKVSLTLTHAQVQWITDRSKTTGLMQSEIVRRAVDTYKLEILAREMNEILTPEQQKEVETIARTRGVPREEVIQRSVEREIQRSKA